MKGVAVERGEKIFRNAKHVLVAVIDTNGERRTASLDQLPCPGKRLHFRPFDIHFDEGGALAGFDFVERDDGNGERVVGGLVGDGLAGPLPCLESQSRLFAPGAGGELDDPGIRVGF